MADVAVTVRQAIRSEQGELIDQEEHCSMDARTPGPLQHSESPIVGRSGSRRPADGRSTP